MNHTRRVFVCLLGFVVILSILVFPVSAQGNDSSEEDYLLQSQKNLDRSLSILNVVATSMEVMVGLLTIVVILLGGFGFFEIKNWRDKRKEIEADAEIIKSYKNKVEEYVETIRSKTKNIPQTVSTEKPTDEDIRKLDYFSRHLETLELLGASLKPEDYLKWGNDFYYKNDSESALKAYDKAIELKPDDDIAWNNKGTVLGKLGRYNEAIGAYDKAIELKPDLANPWFHRACAYSLLDNKEKALSDLKEAIELYAIFKEVAKKDESFKTLWDEEDFKKLVE